jgi:hypothetical protein
MITNIQRNLDLQALEESSVKSKTHDYEMRMEEIKIQEQHCRWEWEKKQRKTKNMMEDEVRNNE